MNDTRARFEEIWPVPEGVYWHETAGEYMPIDGIDHWEDMHLQRRRDSYAARLDTFTRCQETTDVYVSLVEEMVMEIEGLAIAAYGCVTHQSQDILDRAKQIMGDKK